MRVVLEGVVGMRDDGGEDDVVDVGDDGGG